MGVIEQGFGMAFTEGMWATLTESLAFETESAGVITARIAAGPDGVTFLCRRVDWVPDGSYPVRDRYRLSIASSGYVPSLGLAAADGAVAVFFHTHPGGGPAPSTLDVDVDRQLRELFLQRTRQHYFVSLILAGTPTSPSFGARIYEEDPSAPAVLQRIRVIGDRLRVYESSTSDYSPPEQFDRQVRAFGRDGQALLARLRVGVVGVGGTGSAVSEQLIRLGVGQITVLDRDTVVETNLTRIHEASREDLDRAKVELVAKRATAIASGSSVRGKPIQLRSESAVRELTSCDVIFGCTDDVIGRAILSRFAYWYLTPVIDMGFLIDSHRGQIRGLYGRVTSLLPGTACLLCRGRISPEAIYYESLSAEERHQRIQEGYAPELGEPDPSVVAYTTLVASVAVSELLERLFGFGSGRPPSELVLRLADRAISRTSVEGKAGHYCTDEKLWGMGDQEPMLGQVWPGA